MPTLAERAGDLSAIARTLIDPLTGQPFLNNQIPGRAARSGGAEAARADSAPNQAGDRQNFHTVTTTTSDLDDINIRFVKTFGAVPQRGGRGGAGRGGGGGGRGGPGAGRAGVSNLNVTIHYRHSDNTSANPFPTLGGSSTLSAWDIPVSYSFTKAGLTHNAAVRLQPAAAPRRRICSRTR